MALTIPYSGYPEKPCRSNYPFMRDLVGQKYLYMSKRILTEVFEPLLILYTIT